MIAKLTVIWERFEFLPSLIRIFSVRATSRGRALSFGGRFRACSSAFSSSPNIAEKSYEEDMEFEVGEFGLTQSAIRS